LQEFHSKKWGEWGDESPTEKSGATPSPAAPPHYTPDSGSKSKLLILKEYVGKTEEVGGM